MPKKRMTKTQKRKMVEGEKRDRPTDRRQGKSRRRNTRKY